MARPRKKQVDPVIEKQPNIHGLLDDLSARTELLNVISAGATIKDACAFIGISDDTLRRYIKANPEFAASYQKARVTAKVASVGVIRKAAQSNWQAAAWFLERSDPENWGRTTKLLLKVEPDLLKRLQAQADAAGVDLASVFEEMINEFANVDSAGDSETES